MPAPLPYAQDLPAARAVAASIPAPHEEQNFFVKCAVELLAQAILTLSVGRGRDWTVADLMEQLQKPREDFDASGLVDDRARIFLFDVEPRQRASVIATALSLVNYKFGDEPSIAA
ncbi:hypothetical protein [Aureimonas pseudogalii]|uniref:Uncharacterized protein n=1 Tax=Aureimonas pseudogalii TaxID=1744844 RepID=A0A7W6H826_9HYPH|nr:hypothetical protein [Aureimonas pseudogalii]MBB4000148.1 hypothetical protein [Aureimonas pseudogalii]